MMYHSDMNRVQTALDVSKTALIIIGQTVIEVVAGVIIKAMNGKLDSYADYEYNKPVVVLTNTER